MSREDYISKYKGIAVEQMKKYKIPASITLAQGILESGNGNSRLALKGNNHFGIKCHKDWKGRKIHAWDDNKRECFRKYKKVEMSYLDHSFFLSERKRYADLFKHDITDYKSWAKGLKKAGYATNKHYPKLLIKIIEENKLYEFDKLEIASVSSSKKNLKVKIGKDTKFTSGYEFKKENDFKQIEISGNNRKVFENNGKKFIFAVKGDDFHSIAREFKIFRWQVYKYNDLSKNDCLTEGQIVYLQRKKRKAEQKFHKFRKNETMYSVSQLYGIRLRLLYKWNDMDDGELPRVGERIRLR